MYDSAGPDARKMLIAGEYRGEIGWCVDVAEYRSGRWVSTRCLKPKDMASAGPLSPEDDSAGRTASP